MQDRVTQLRAFLQESPDDLFLNHALALECVKLGDVAEGERLFRKNLSHDAGYVATYYHLGKLLQQAGRRAEALAIYEQGMQQAKAARDNHSYNELQGAYEDLEDE
jgi:tetratricopeptide (TPR) repeat protein